MNFQIPPSPLSEGAEKCFGKEPAQMLHVPGGAEQLHQNYINWARAVTGNQPGDIDTDHAEQERRFLLIAGLREMPAFCYFKYFEQPFMKKSTR